MAKHLRNFVNPYIFGFSLILAATVSFLVYQAVSLQRQSQIDTAVSAARSYNHALNNFSNYYLTEVTPKAKKAGVKFTDGPNVDEGSLPLLYSLLIDLAERSTPMFGGGQFRLYSNFPWPMRGTGGPKTDVEKNILKRLESKQEKELIVVHDTSEGRKLTYATPVVLKQFCLNCHNTDTRIGKNDWKAGDVRAAQTISLNLPAPTIIPNFDNLAKFPTLIALSLFLIAIIGYLLQRILRIEKERDRNEQYAHVLQNVGEGVISLCDDGNIWSCNVAAEKIFGYSADEIVGLSADQLFVENPLVDYLDNVKHNPSLGTLEVETYARHKNGTTLPIGLTINKNPEPIPFHNHIIACRDLTGVKKMEEQLRFSERLRTVGILAGGIAHNFNNLLLVIMGNAEILESRKDPKDKATDNAVNAIYQASARGEQLSDQLLSFGLEQSLNEEVVDLGDLMRKMQIILETAVYPDCKVHVEIEDSDLSVQVDTGQFKDALLNLATNARDSMNHGGEVTFRVHRAVRELTGKRTSEYVIIETEDNGCGIAEDHLEHIFEPFFTTKEVGKGTGLGLSMVYGFMEQTGGTVDVKSELGKGTRVELYFHPVDHQADSKVA